MATFRGPENGHVLRPLCRTTKETMPVFRALKHDRFEQLFSVFRARLLHLPGNGELAVGELPGESLTAKQTHRAHQHG